MVRRGRALLKRDTDRIRIQPRGQNAIRYIVVRGYKYIWTKFELSTTVCELQMDGRMDEGQRLMQPPRELVCN